MPTDDEFGGVPPGPECDARVFADRRRARLAPAGVASIVRQRWRPPRRPGEREAPVWLAVGLVRSPGDLGTILRTALARMTPAHLAAWKRRTGTLVVGTSSTARRDFRDEPRRRPTVVVLGCERRGMSRAQRRACDFTVSIPMAAGVDSLNVGVAAGIVLFAVRHP